MFLPWLSKTIFLYSLIYFQCYKLHIQSVLLLEQSLFWGKNKRTQNISKERNISHRVFAILSKHMRPDKTYLPETDLIKIFKF